MSHDRNAPEIRGLVADRSAKTGRVVAQIFQTASGFRCVGIATEPGDFTGEGDSSRLAKADVLLLDPGPDGTEWVEPVRALQESGAIRGVVIFSLYRRFAEEPISRQSNAFLKKDCGFEELLMTVKSVANGTRPESHGSYSDSAGQQ